MGAEGHTMELHTTTAPTISTKEAAKMIGCSWKHVHTLIDAGKLRPIDISLEGAKRRCLRFSLEEIHRFLRDARVKPVDTTTKAA